MRRKASRQVCRRAAGRLPLALLCLAALCLVAAPAFASDVRVHYEDAFDDVLATQASEREIKAAFLLRFPDFVSWRSAPGDTLRIGVIGDDALLEILSRLAEQANEFRVGESRLVAVTGVSTAAEAQQCAILVLGEAVTGDPVPALTAAHEAGALTVGIWNEPRSGTVIRLFREGSRVRFDISQALAKEAGLHISSRLLSLAANNQVGWFLRRTLFPEDPPRS